MCVGNCLFWELSSDLFELNEAAGSRKRAFIVQKQGYYPLSSLVGRIQKYLLLVFKNTRAGTKAHLCIVKFQACVYVCA